MWAVPSCESTSVLKVYHSSLLTSVADLSTNSPTILSLEANDRCLVSLLFFNILSDSPLENKKREIVFITQKIMFDVISLSFFKAV